MSPPEGAAAAGAAGWAGWIQRAMVSNMCSTSSGLLMWSFMPLDSACSRSLASALAVIAMMGRFFQAGWLRMRAVAV